MRIALVGFGKMGQSIFRLAPQFNCEIVSIVDPHHPHANFQELNYEAVSQADLVIDFSHPSCAGSNLFKAIKYQKSVVMGTTGFQIDMDQVQDQAIENQVAVLASSNFSVGIYLISQMLANMGQIDNLFEIQIEEIHHEEKKDAPSGTALSLAKVIKSKSSTHIEMQSLRRGRELGTHRVIIESENERICIEHKSKNRDIYAHGALKAALWLKTKVGFFNLNDMYANR